MPRIGSRNGPMAQDNEMNLLIQLMDEMVVDANTASPAQAVKRIDLLARIILLRQKDLASKVGQVRIFNPDEGRE